MTDRLNRIERDVDPDQELPFGVDFWLHKGNMMIVRVQITGPMDTCDITRHAVVTVISLHPSFVRSSPLLFSPYEGGVFYVELNLNEYPAKAPKVKWLTKTFHPNIEDNGEICHVVVLHAEYWKPEITVVKVRYVCDVS